MARNTEDNVNHNDEIEVLVVEGPTEGVTEETSKTDADAVRELAEEKFGEEYTIDKVVIDGPNVNVLAQRKDDSTNVALRLEM